jgi:KDO2-lipid IV(A) lauroyltransferase
MKYSCRTKLFSLTDTFELATDQIVRSNFFGTKTMKLADIAEYTVFKERRFGSSRSYWACTMFGKGQTVSLTAAHRHLIGTDDRTAIYIQFIKQFERQLLSVNPNVRFVNDEYRETLATKVSGVLALFSVQLLSNLTRSHATSLCGFVFSRVGVLLRSHRYARQQLKMAFPEIGQRATNQILKNIWDNIGRTFAEYAHFAELMELSIEPLPVGPVTMDQRTINIVRRISAERSGAMIFAAHIGNWEIPAMVARVCGRQIAAVYKRQPGRAMTEYLVQMRSRYAAQLIEANRTAPLKMRKALQNGFLVGMLVDQHFPNGIEVKFFGHACKVNPIVARFARHYNCPVYGARAVRMPDESHRFELVGPLQFPRDNTGKIDVQNSMQLIFGLLETWIREYPEQWMWFSRMLRENNGQKTAV